MLICEKVWDIKQSGADSDRGSNNDSHSKGYFRPFDIETNKISSHSIKAAEEGLMQFVSTK